jgi:hypothetical protein
MKIRSHSESHLVELDDGSKWQIFPGDLDVTLNWKPDTELKLVRIEDPVSSHALVSGGDNSSVRVLPAGEKWPVDQVRTVLKNNQWTLIASRVLSSDILNKPRLTEPAMAIIAFRWERPREVMWVLQRT